VAPVVRSQVNGSLPTMLNIKAVEVQDRDSAQ